MGDMSINFDAVVTPPLASYRLTASFFCFVFSISIEYLFNLEPTIYQIILATIGYLEEEGAGEIHKT